MERALLVVMLACQALLIGLKLSGLIDWTWWSVLAPTWAPLVVAGVAVAIQRAVGGGPEE